MAAIHWDSFFFLLFVLVTCVFAIAVAVSNNIVRMATYLVASLCGVAGLFFLCRGRVPRRHAIDVLCRRHLVLLIFGVMLTARGPFVSMRSGGGQWILALSAGGSLLAVLLQAVLRSSRTASRGPASCGSRHNLGDAQLGAGLVGVRTDKAREPGQFATRHAELPAAV